MISKSLHATDPVKEVKVDIFGEKPPKNKTLKSKRPLKKWKSFPDSANNSFRGSRSKKWTEGMASNILHINENSLPKLPEEEEAVGIITMEDVIEELLQVNITVCYSYYIISPQQFLEITSCRDLIRTMNYVGGDL